MFYYVSLIPVSIQNFGSEVQNSWPIVVAFITIFTVVRYVIKWAYREYREDFAEMKELIIKEIQPNGGDSMKDSITNVRETLTRLEPLVEEVVKKNASNSIKLDMLIQNADTAAYFETDSQGNLIDVNQKFCDMFDITTEEARAAFARQLVHPDDRSRVQEAFLESLKYGHTYIAEYRFHKKHDFSTWHNARVKAFPTQHGGLIGFVEEV